LPEARDRAHDQLRVDLLEVVVRDSQLRHGAGSEVLDDDVRRLDELLEQLHAIAALEVHSDPFLAVVELNERSRGFSHDRWEIRTSSPRSGFSILMTSAPMSAR